MSSFQQDTDSKNLVDTAFVHASPSLRCHRLRSARADYYTLRPISTMFSSTIRTVAASAATAVPLRVTKSPITDLRDDSTTSATRGSGRTKLSTTWLRIIALIELQLSAMTKAGTIVIRRRAQTGMRQPTKPCMISWPAIVPTTELEIPEAINAIRNT